MKLFLIPILYILIGCVKPVGSKAQERIECPAAYFKGKPKPQVCTKIAEYNWGKLMGYSYGVEYGIWFDSTSSRCCTCFQNDLQVLNARLNNGQTNVVYLDFGGGVIEDSHWGVVTYSPSGLSAEDNLSVFDRVASHYVGMNVVFTTDYNTYINTPQANRQRVVFTTTCGWLSCNNGGGSILNSFGTEVCSWVFTYPLNYNVHNIGESGAHETGHTLGLLHQSVWQ